MSHIWVVRFFEWVMSHVWMSQCHITHMNEWVLLMSHESCHTCEWVGVGRHVTYMSAWVLLPAVNESIHTYEWGSSRECVSGTYQRQNEGAATRWLPLGLVCCSVLLCVAARCSLLQRVAACCSALQRVAACCSTLQRVAARCSDLGWKRETRERKRDDSHITLCQHTARSCPQKRPISLPKSPVSLQKSPISLEHRLVTGHTGKRALSLCKRDLSLCQRAQYLCKRAPSL